MEWVETTGKSVDEAVELALDKLGVDRNEAEIEVLEEAKSGLFGRVRSDARVRARVMPTKPRAKEDRKRAPRTVKTDAPAAAEVVADVPAPAPTRARRPSAAKASSSVATSEDSPASSAGANSDSSDAAADPDAIAERFLLGLLQAFGLEGTFERHDVADGLVEYRIVGSDLGVLIGPKAQTLTAIQELLRTVVHYESDGHSGRILLDVAGTVRSAAPRSMSSRGRLPQT